MICCEIIPYILCVVNRIYLCIKQLHGTFHLNVFLILKRKKFINFKTIASLSESNSLKKKTYSGVKSKIKNRLNFVSLKSYIKNQCVNTPQFVISPPDISAWEGSILVQKYEI